MTALVGARPSRRALRATIVVVAGLVLAVPGPAAPAAPAVSPALAAKTAVVSPDNLRREIVDVALLPSAGSSAAPRLLTVEQDPVVEGRNHLTVLERVGGRWSASGGAIDDPPVIGATAAPWLVALDARRFVLITVAPELGETWIRTVTWTGEELRLGPRRAIPRRIDDAGAADVDGDGDRELVLAEAPAQRLGAACLGTTLLVAQPSTMRVTSQSVVSSVRLATGTIGRLDDVPGDDLVATAYRNCSAVGFPSSQLVLVAIRLSDGRRLLDREIDAADPTSAWSGRPTLVDLERDLRPEVVLGSPDGALVVSPQHAWRIDTLRALPGALLGVREAVGSGRAGAVVATMAPDSVQAAFVRRTPEGWVVEMAGRVERGAIGDDAWTAAVADGHSAALHLRGGPTWLDGASPCSPLILTLAALPCWPRRNPPSQAEAALIPGRAWLATRPLGRVGGPGSPILVARSDRRSGTPSRLTAPGPLAAEPTAASWRHGPSGPFTLAEVEDVRLLHGRAEQPSVEPGVNADEPEIVIGAPAGSRLLVAVAPSIGDASALDAPDLSDLLASPDDASMGVLLHGVHGEATDGAGGQLRFPLPAPAGVPADQASWEATVIAIGPLGDISATVHARVGVDRTAPALAISRPFLSAPWPFGTTLSGSTEPGADLESGGQRIPVRPDGSFDLPVHLAPWPQRVELRAVDRSGNETLVRADVVGGIDYRGLPWVVIVVAGLVGAALVGGLRTGSNREAVGRSAESDPLDPIEELQPVLVRVARHR